MRITIKKDKLTSTFNVEFQSFLELMISIVILLECRTVYDCLVGRELRSILSALLLIFLLYKIPKTKLNRTEARRMLSFVAIYYIIVIWYFVINAQNSLHSLGYILKFGIILPMMVFIIVIDETFVYKIMHNILLLVTALSVISLVFWLLGSVMHIIARTGYVTIYWGGLYRYPSYYGLYFERQYENFFGNMIMRNIGIFTEAPMYNFVLAMAILTNTFLFSETKRMRWVNLILFLTLMSTFSTTGIIVGAMILVCDYIIKNPRNQIIYVLKKVLGVILVPTIIYLAYMVFLQKINNAYGWSGRLNGIIGGVQTFIKNPLSGTGFGDSVEAIQYATGGFRYEKNISGLGNVIAQGGILLTSVYAYAFLSPFLYSRKSDIRIKIYSAIVFTEFLVVIIQYTTLMLIQLAFFISMGIKSHDEIKKRYVDRATGQQS